MGLFCTRESRHINSGIYKITLDNFNFPLTSSLAVLLLILRKITFSEMLLSEFCIFLYLSLDP